MAVRCTRGASGRRLLRSAPTDIGCTSADQLAPAFCCSSAPIQAVLEDMPELLADEPLLLDALRAGDSAGGLDLAVAAAAAVAASPGGGPAAAGAGRARLARAAANAGSQLGKLLYLTEHLLALLYTHLRLCLPAPALAAASPDKGMLALAANGGGAEGGPGLQTLGSERVSGEGGMTGFAAKGGHQPLTRPASCLLAHVSCSFTSTSACSVLLCFLLLLHSRHGCCAGQPQLAEHRNVCSAL